MKNTNDRFKAPDVRTLTELALLTAVVLVMAATPMGYLRVGPLTMSLLTVPVAIGGMPVGPAGGAWMGFVFGMTSFANAVNGTGGLTAYAFQYNPVLCFLTCVGTRVACGLCCAVFCFVMGRSLWLDAAFFSVISALLMGVNTLLLTFLPLRFSIYGRASGVAGLFNFCAYLGAGCSGVISGWLADLGGWNTTVLLWLALCVLGLAGIWAGFRKKIPVSES